MDCQSGTRTQKYLLVKSKQSSVGQPESFWNRSEWICRMRKGYKSWSGHLLNLAGSTYWFTFVVKCLFLGISCGIVNDRIIVNPRYDSDLKFKHLFARTQRLHLSPVHVFPRVWGTLPKDLRNDLLLLRLDTWCTHLKSYIHTHSI